MLKGAKFYNIMEKKGCIVSVEWEEEMVGGEINGNAWAA